ncbi:MAG: class II fructose-bisphosphate aldolase [Actinomycetota bacterium]|nr:class II fructose-bisphosphate aldolase [Actinomycetota bacterium]
MPLVGSELLIAARAQRTGVGAFNVIQLEHAEALVAGAEAAHSPVILQISQNAARYHRGLAPIGLATLRIARNAVVPVIVHLDHATDETLIDEAIALGFTSVMYDGATLSYAENRARTAAIVDRAHVAGVWVEAELGEVGGKDGAHAPGVKTDPVDAAAFVAATGVDALAIAVGSSHAMTERTAAVDLDRIAEIAAAVSIPLVLHGSSGIPDDAIAAGVLAGLTKINVSTHLNKVFTAALRDHLAADLGIVDPRKYLGAAREALATEVTRLIGVIRG